MKTPPQKVVKHRHRYSVDYIDCPVCGAGTVWICDCGELKEDWKEKVPTSKTRLAVERVAKAFTPTLPIKHKRK